MAKRREFSDLAARWRGSGAARGRGTAFATRTSCSDPRRAFDPAIPRRMEETAGTDPRGGIVVRALWIAVGVFVLIQAVPYGRDHANPAVSAEPVWKGEHTRELFLRGCQDCHSNETRWPWYASIAPASWLVQRDVDEGREHLNVSQWGRGKQHGDEAASMLRKDEMPPWFYRPAHPEARLTEAEKQELIRGLVDTFGEKKHGGAGAD
jgi:mono/diheme cytochrome c family protein